MTDVVQTSFSPRHTRDWRALRRGLTVPVGLAVAWSLAAHAQWIKSPLFVPLDEIIIAPFVDEAGQQMWIGLLQSAGRLALGFVVGAAAGLGLGLLIGMSRLADRAVAPSFNALRQITLFAWIPLLTAWFGNGEGAKIVYLALSAFFPVALNTHEGLRTIALHHIEVAKVLRLSRWRTVTRLLLPGALPSIFVGMQVALITAWIGTVGAEYAMGLGRGLGTFIAEGRGQFRMDLVLLGVTMLALVGYAINAACRYIFARLLRWQEVR